MAQNPFLVKNDQNEPFFSIFRHFAGPRRRAQTLIYAPKASISPIFSNADRVDTGIPPLKGSKCRKTPSKKPLLTVFWPFWSFLTIFWKLILPPVASLCMNYTQRKRVKNE